MPASAANATGAVTDSIFTWTFTATSGDSWGGSLVEDSSRYEVGSTVDTAYGRYTIVAEAVQAGSLAPYGFPEGWIAVAWYRDSGGSWMLTRLGEAAAAGLAGLGSELDAAWTGSAWDSFGLGGADQADPGALADSLFTWTFTYDGGDVLEGTLLADTRDWNVGDTLRAAHGTYRITGETPYGRDLGATGVEGTVHTTRYRDADAAIDFALESDGLSPTGYAGLGSELDRAWNGSEWQQVGEGGALVADRVPDRIFQWRFEATGGDQWLGTFIGHRTAWSKGDVLETAHGHYVITGQSAYAGTVAQQGLTWVSAYYDASAGTWLPVQESGAGRTPVGARGPGSEYAHAWNGVAWDDFGHGGAERASIPRLSVYGWTFTAWNGDRYTGWEVGSDELHGAGDTIPTDFGSYRIDAEYDWNGSQGPGAVWTSGYYDLSTDRWLPTYAWGTLGGQPSGSGGLGSEWDRAWDDDEWIAFGRGGLDLAGVIVNHVFGWTFSADNGDSYVGWLVEDATLYAPGDTIAAAHGSYRIDAEYDWHGAQGRGAIWTSGYHDQPRDRWLVTYDWDRLGGQPSGYGGFGSEHDAAWDGNEWDGFGLGGADLADIAISYVFGWTFTATGGDRYVGWVVEDSRRYKPGDTVTTAFGSYHIDVVYDWNGAEARGAVWTSGYAAQPGDRWLATEAWGTLGGQPSGHAGLGSEYDRAWDGDEWDDFGHGGAELASVATSHVFGWTFTATSGDAYVGWLVADAARYKPGDTIATAFGSYHVDAEYDWNGSELRGAIWVSGYRDAGSAHWMPTWSWQKLGGQPCGHGDFGSELDSTWTGQRWDSFGHGGAEQADRPTAAPDTLVG